MKRYIAIILCITASTSLALADDHARRAPETDDAISSATKLVDEPLFDFPISRAVGIDVEKWVRTKQRPLTIYDLAAPRQR